MEQITYLASIFMPIMFIIFSISLMGAVVRAIMDAILRFFHDDHELTIRVDKPTEKPKRKNDEGRYEPPQKRKNDDGYFVWSPEAAQDSQLLEVVEGKPKRGASNDG